MERKQAFRLAAVVAMFAVAAPIVLALYLARNDARNAEFDRVESYAVDVLNRTDRTADQVDAGFRRLVASGAAPCSEAELAVMREIDLASSYLQSIGRIEGDTLTCSSLGVDTGLVLGPVDVVTPRAVSIRTDVRFPFAGDASFLVLERDGFAAVIHKDLPIDATTADPGDTLATFLRSSAHVLSVRGHVDPAWLQQPLRAGRARFIDGDRIVVVATSDRYHTGAVAAVSDAALQGRVRRSAALLLPLGLLAGLLMAGVIAYLARVQTAMPALLKAALRRGELFVQYQPVVELASGRWIGAEALVRWKRATGEMVRPDLFVPVAEESGLIQQVTARVLALVTADLRVLRERHPDFHVSVNLASSDLHSPATVDRLREVLQASGSAPAQLHIEATERGFMDTEVAGKVMQAIRALGIRIAIDDFGTGYSSLSYLESFALDYLKIDKTFVDTVVAEAATSQVVPHIIEMAKSLRLQMIAEGVETEAQAQFLRERGVQYAQGWLFSKPLAFDALLQGLATRGD